jgi:hypothetical protein
VESNSPLACPARFMKPALENDSGSVDCDSDGGLFLIAIASERQSTSSRNLDRHQLGTTIDITSER